MAVVSSAGTILYIGGTGALGSESAWEPVGEITDMGEFGRVYELITHNPIGTRATQKFKGSYNDGTMTLEMGRDPADAGQADIAVAVDSDLSFNFKIELNDSPQVSPNQPTTYTFKAKVMSYPTVVGTVNDYVRSTVQLEVDGSITTTPAGP